MQANLFEVFYAKTRLFNVGVIGNNFGLGVEYERHLPCHHTFRVANVTRPKQELAVQVGDIDCVQINDLKQTDAGDLESYLRPKREVELGMKIPQCPRCPRALGS